MSDQRQNVEPQVRQGIKSVTIRTIPHADQRYPTCGDWIFDEQTGELQILASDTGDWRESLTIAIHELTEAALCVQRGVLQADVDRFDQQFEEAYALSPASFTTSEPGEIPAAPYYPEHMAATVVERLFAWQIGLHWPAYELNIEDLDKQAASE